MNRKEQPRLYRIYASMKQRCYNRNYINFDLYGGQNIKICDEWLSSFEVFSDWALNSGYTDELTIDRIDPCKNYCPENCRWVTKNENSGHTRRWTNPNTISNKKTTNKICAYPAIFHYEDGEYWVEFPDLKGCHSDGNTIEKALEQAQIALDIHLTAMLNNNMSVPSPSLISNIFTNEKNSFVSYVTCNMSKIQRRKRIIKKTISIPEWLNEEAEKRHLNFSGILQEALKERLGV